MGHYTRYTARFLDRRYRRDEDGAYLAHMPIWGVGQPGCEPGHVVRLARLFQILRTLASIRFDTLLDVGGGEGYLPYLAREHLGARAASSDLSIEACIRARELFDIDAVAMDGARLPFADRAFDVVVCSEVVEHVEFAVESMLELERVAKVAVVFTTEEVEFDRAKIERALLRRCGYPHFERNLLHPDDLRTLFGDRVALRRQLEGVPPADATGVEDARAWIAAATAERSFGPAGLGVVAEHVLEPEARLATPAVGDAELLDRLLSRSQVSPRGPRAAGDLSAWVAERVVCPLTRGPLARDGRGFASGGGRRYALREGVPVLRDLDVADPTEDELRARLAVRWPGEDARLEAAVALRARLVLPNATDKRRWDFAAAADRRGWMPAQSVEERPGEGLAFVATDRDPWVASPGLQLRAAEVAAVRIRMRVHNPDYPVDAPVGQLFWLGEDDDALDEARCATFPVLNDGSMHEYRVEVARCPGWPSSGEVLFLRIDPVDGPAEIDVVEVVIEERG